MPIPPRAHVPHSRSPLCRPQPRGAQNHLLRADAQAGHGSWAQGHRDCLKASSPPQVSHRHPDADPSFARPSHSQRGTKKPGWAYPAPPGNSQLFLRRTSTGESPLPAQPPPGSPRCPFPRASLISWKQGGQSGGNRGSPAVGKPPCRPHVPPGRQPDSLQGAASSPLGVGPRPPPAVTMSLWSSGHTIWPSVKLDLPDGALGTAYPTASSGVGRRPARGSWDLPAPGLGVVSPTPGPAP